MPGPIASRLKRATWREWGFDLKLEEMAEVDDFFSHWHAIYNPPGAYRSWEALFASRNGVRLFIGHLKEGAERRNAVSVIRAGYCIALVERSLGMRQSADPNLETLFAAMEEDAPSVQNDAMALANAAGHSLGDVAWSMTVDKPEIGQTLAGFHLREAVFTDLRHTLFLKLRLTSWPPYLDADLAEVAVRYGHAVGVAEEALPQTHPPGSDSP